MAGDTSAHVQVAPDSTGAKIDAAALTTPEDNLSTVLRQVIALGDPDTYGNLAQIDLAGQQFVRADALIEPLHAILTELRLLRLTISSMGNVYIDEKEAH